MGNPTILRHWAYTHSDNHHPNPTDPDGVIIGSLVGWDGDPYTVPTPYRLTVHWDYARKLRDRVTIANQYATRLIRPTNHPTAPIVIRHHSTDIVRMFASGVVVVDVRAGVGEYRSVGLEWTSATTKARIPLPSGIHLWSERGVWFVGSGRRQPNPDRSPYNRRCVVCDGSGVNRWRWGLKDTDPDRECWRCDGVGHITITPTIPDDSGPVPSRVPFHSPMTFATTPDGGGLIID